MDEEPEVAIRKTKELYLRSWARTPRDAREILEEVVKGQQIKAADFEGLIGKKNNGEFPTQKLGNLALSRLCDTFYSKYYIFAIKHLNMSYFQTYDTLYEIFCVPR